MKIYVIYELLCVGQVCAIGQETSKADYQEDHFTVTTGVALT